MAHGKQIETATPKAIPAAIPEAMRALGFSVVGMNPVGKGGSARFFFRVQLERGDSVIFIAYDKPPEENTFYAPLADYLLANGINAPAVLAHDRAAGHIVMQDLGDDDLYAQRRGTQRLSFYKLALAEIHKLHSIVGKSAAINNPIGRTLAINNLLASPLPPMLPPFSEATFRWEREYFWEQFVRPLATAAVPAKMPVLLDTELASLAQRLLTCRQSLIHRDFQSQNVMLHVGKTYLIDFQGMRWGNPFYDVASLLFDPYVELDKATRSELFAYYQSLSNGAGSPPSAGMELPSLLYEAALARLLQALGAYGFLSLQKGKIHFIKHVPRALANLQDVLKKLPQYSQTTELIATIDKNRLQQQIHRILENTEQ